MNIRAQMTERDKCGKKMFTATLWVVTKAGKQPNLSSQENG